MNCHFPHDEKAVVALWFDEGCICYPEDQLQHLCLQHARDTTPIGGVRLVALHDFAVWPLLRDMGWRL